MNTSLELTDLKSQIKTLSIPEDKKGELLAKAERIARPLDTDPWIYRLVVLFLGTVVLSTVVGGLVLVYKGAGRLPIRFQMA